MYFSGENFSTTNEYEDSGTHRFNNIVFTGENSITWSYFVKKSYDLRIVVKSTVLHIFSIGKKL